MSNTSEITTEAELRRFVAAERRWWRGLSDGYRRRLLRRDPLLEQVVGTVSVWAGPGKDVMPVVVGVKRGNGRRVADDLVARLVCQGWLVRSARTFMTVRFRLVGRGSKRGGA